MKFLDLGLAPYEETQSLMAVLRSAVADDRLAGVLLLLEHPPVITLGSRGRLDDLLPVPSAGSPHPVALPVIRSERGGAATLHAPGQLVSYPIMRLPRRDLRSFVRGLEEVILRVLGDHGIEGECSAGRPGVYVRGAKIASVGLRCHRWVSSHGTSLNVSLDLSLFDRIVSCGEPGLEQTSLAALLASPPHMAQVKARYAVHFAEVFAQEPRVIEPATLEEAWRLTAS